MSCHDDYVGWQASLGLVAFISFFLVAAVFEGNYGEEAIDDDSIY